MALLLHCMQNALAEKRKTGLAVHLSLNELQFGHMPFDHPIIDRPG